MKPDRDWADFAVALLAAIIIGILLIWTTLQIGALDRRVDKLEKVTNEWNELVGGND